MNKLIQSRIVFILGTCLIGMVLTGCEEMLGQPKDDTPPSTSTVLSYELPSVEVVPAGSETQTQGKVIVSMTPPTFVVKRVTSTRCTQLPALLITNNQYPYRIEESPRAIVEPDGIAFKVKVHNHLARVLKLDGAIFKFSIGGAEKTLDEAGYKAFQRGVILPEQEAEFTIAGPSVASVPAGAVFSFSIYDIVTETDKAGNPTDRGNFEWNFKMVRQRKTENATIETSTAKMTQVEARERCR